MKPYAQVRKRVAFQLACAVVLAFAFAPSTATSAVDAATQKAKALYDDGVTDYNLGHYDQALASFEQAYRLRHDAVFLFNIGQCQRQLHQFEEAERSYRAYLRESPNLPDETKLQVQKLIAEMNKAIDEQRAKQPPTGTQPPASRTTDEAHGGAPTNAQPAPTPTAATADNRLVATPPSKKSVAKSPWFWTGIVGGAVIVGGAIALGVVFGTHDPVPSAGKVMGP